MDILPQWNEDSNKCNVSDMNIFVVTFNLVSFHEMTICLYYYICSKHFKKSIIILSLSLSNLNKVLTQQHGKPFNIFEPF